MLSIALIGCTGSIGKQVCSVVRRYPDLYRFSGMVAHTDYQTFSAQLQEFHPTTAVLLEGSLADKMTEIPQDVAFYTGEEAAIESIEQADVVFVAASGFAGLKYSLKAIECKKRLALANKETLVCGGEMVMEKVNRYGVDLVPVDSEHSALWQALHFNRNGEYKRLIITASGGPFYGYTKEQLKNVTVKSALNHPTWKMGPKITIDSATLLNKGFEVIEAKWLYDASYDQIHTVVQPESIIHSMVEFADGGILAQMSYPTMELPIQLALTYPNRADCGLKPLDFEALGQIRFKPLNRKDFPCYDLALTAGESGDNYPCVLNAAGEVAVHAFLKEKIAFTDISKVIEETLSQTERQKATDYGTLVEIDRRARVVAEGIIKNAK